ncbi:MAG: sigma-54 dependent transcriptional regulator [Candidatus Lernaella stagnicola]|nr:sigma-54 dependent transcriptional regulator [Candidatus Lernaella stagnicola]
MKPRVLVVDDEVSMREFLEIFLAKAGYEVITAAGGKTACELLDRHRFDLVITDLRMPEVDGMQVLKKAKQVDSAMPVLMVTAYASHETAVQAMKEGALDYFTKPFNVDEVRLIVSKALERRELSRENIALKQQLGERYGFGNLVGSDPRMLEIYDMIRRVAGTPTSILITGETGTGKELVARAMHVNSNRSDHSFVVINCGAIPAELLESELFGHRKGSFTGAIADKKGLFEIASGGTVFLDEIGELPMALQVKLLRALQERRIMPVGSMREVEIDVRVVCATNRDLEHEVKEGQFREDLFYRLNVIQIAMPPLRDRRGDIPLLANFFLEKYVKILGRDIRRISSEAMNFLQSYGYPGNVRELENIMERAVALEIRDVIMPDSLPPHVLRQDLDMSRLKQHLSIPPQGVNLDEVMLEIEADFLAQALELSGGGKKAAAELLGISFRSFRYRLSKLGVDPGKDDEEDDLD